jgi:hypothetical protein
VITEWESQFESEDLHLRSLYRDGWVVTEYGPGGGYCGDEGEMYDLESDPLQWENRWGDPALKALKEDLLADLHDHLPPPRQPRLAVEAPV